MKWSDKLKLNNGDELKLINKFEAGSLGQKERYTYEIINSEGVLVDRVKYSVNTSIKSPYTENYTVCQYDGDGNEVFFERW